MGKDAASPTSFYDEWNTSTAKTERTEEGTLEPPLGTQADPNVGKVPSGSRSDIEGDMASAASQLSPTTSDTEGGAVQLRPTKSDTESGTTPGKSTHMDFEGEGLLLRPRDSDTTSGATQVRPTAQLPAVTSHSWRDRNVLLYADGQQKEQEEEVEEEKGVLEKQEEQENQEEQESQEEQEQWREHEEGGLYDLSTVTGWRQEMSTGNTAKVTNTEASTAQEATTTDIIPTAKVATTTIKTRTPIQTTQGRITIRKSDGRYIEPTFLFTTESSRRTKQLELTTTQGGEEEEASLSPVMPSHFFQLEDYPQDDNSTNDQLEGSDQEEEETTEKFPAARTPSGKAGVRESWLYRVNNTGEEGSNSADNNTSEEGSNTADNNTSEEENNTADIDIGEGEWTDAMEVELETTEGANITQVL